jgi:hypothetical protein
VKAQFSWAFLKLLTGLWVILKKPESFNGEMGFKVEGLFDKRDSSLIGFNSSA